MPTVSAQSIGIALRFVISIGLTPAIPAQMMVAPAIGDIVRPSVPPSVAMLPIWTCDMPKSGAYGVMASLKANVAASPEPVKRPSRNGPKAAQILTMAGLLSIASMNHLTRPIDVRPATKTPAE